MNLILKTLKNLMDKKGYSENRLSGISSVPQSTINSMFKKNNMPSIATLDQLCSALDISMSRFFYIVEQEKNVNGNTLYTQESSDYPITKSEHKILEQIKVLTGDDQILVEKLISSLAEKKD